jgi:hypothetical protein
MMYHHLALAHGLWHSACRADRKPVQESPLSPRKQRLATNIRLVENVARTRVRRNIWLSRAYYGFCIPSAMLATIATSSMLAHHPAVAGVCSAAAGAMTAALACLRRPYERGVVNAPLNARYEALVLRARELLNSARNSTLANLEASTVRLETDLELLLQEEAGAVRRRTRRTSATRAVAPEGS